MALAFIMGLKRSVLSRVLCALHHHDNLVLFCFPLFTAICQSLDPERSRSSAGVPVEVQTCASNVQAISSSSKSHSMCMHMTLCIRFFLSMSKSFLLLIVPFTYRLNPDKLQDSVDQVHQHLRLQKVKCLILFTTGNLISSVTWSDPHFSMLLEGKFLHYLKFTR